MPFMYSMFSETSQGFESKQSHLYLLTGVENVVLPLSKVDAQEPYTG